MKKNPYAQMEKDYLNTPDKETGLTPADLQEIAELEEDLRHGPGDLSLICDIEWIRAGRPMAEDD